MSKEAEEFFRQKTIENAKRPRMKKFLALVNREAEGKILQEYTDQQLRLYSVSQQRELLLAYENYTSEMIIGKTNERTAKSLVDGFLANNCG